MRSIYAYAGSDKFNPAQALDLSYLDTLFNAPDADVMQKLGATISDVDSQAPGGYDATNLLDGDPTTIWHTPWGANATPFPHHVTIEFKEAAKITGVVCLPRQDMQNALIKAYRIDVSDDGKTWREAAHGDFTDSWDEQRIRFPEPETVRYVRFTALSGWNPADPFVALAEISVTTE